MSADPISLMLGDPNAAYEHRKAILRDLINASNPEADAIIQNLFANLSAKTEESIYKDKLAKVNTLLRELQEGPLRQGVFVQMVTMPGNHNTQAAILLDDGAQLFTVVPDEALARQLRKGDRVILDGKGRAVLCHAPEGLKVGEVAQLERCIDASHLEVSLRAGADRSVFFAPDRVMEQIHNGTLSPGATLIVNPRQSFVIDAVPPEEGLKHYRFLDRGPVPKVTVEEHIGAPPRCIQAIDQHVRTELTRPHVHRRYRIRPSCMWLLSGVSGSGKTLAVNAIHRRLYDIMSEVTGVPLTELPPLVFKIRQDQVLSHWFGDSEKNWSRALTEVETIANQEFTTRDGRKLKLPVLVVIEEIDGIGRARGHEAVYDRVLTTVLQRLDPNRTELSERLIVFIATTNEPQLVDAAMLRRVGGCIEHFGRLKSQAFRAVLAKHVRGLPVASNNGFAPEEVWKRHIQNLNAWFYSPNSTDPGLVELVYAGSTAPVIKHRRDFLTGALVDRAVQEAAHEAAEEEQNSDNPAGITLDQLARAFDRQLRGIVDQLREHNVGHYTDLPDGVRVATLRRIPQPAQLPFEFQRN